MNYKLKTVLIAGVRRRLRRTAKTTENRGYGEQRPRFSPAK